MGTLNDKLDKVLESKQTIKTAVNNKGGNITDDTLLSQYDDIINQLEVLTTNMKSDIDALNNSSGTYEQKLDTAVSNITSYLNTLANYVDPDYSFTSSPLKSKLSSINNRLNSQLSSARTAIINKDSSVSITSPYNLDKIITGINNIKIDQSTTTVNSSLSSSATSYLEKIDDTNQFNTVDQAYTWAYACYSRLRNAYSYLYRAVNGTSSTTYRYPLDDELYSLASSVYSLGVGGSSVDTKTASTGGSTSFSSHLSVSGLSSYDNVIGIRTSTSGNSTGDGGVYLAIRKSGSSYYGFCQTIDDKIHRDTISYSSSQLGGSTYGWYAGSYTFYCWDN